MKIAIVSEHASPLAVLSGTEVGAQSVYVDALSAALARLGHRVKVYTRRDDRTLRDEVDTPQRYTVVHVSAGPPEHLPEQQLLQYMGAFAQFLDADWAVDRPDVTHAHYWMSGVATQLAARHLNLPAVQTFHGVVERRHQGLQGVSPPQRPKLEAMVAKGATWVAATCTDEVFELARMGRPRSRISVVPYGVDLNLFTPDGPKAPRTAPHRIVSVGRLVPRMGFDHIIRALTVIPDTEFVLAGAPDTAEACRLRNLAAELGVDDRVRLQGSVARKDMPALLRSADVVACTPWYEPFGLVALEAMACGIPVVASAVGGMLDTVVDDVTGRLVPPNRPAELANALSDLLRDEFLRQSLGAAGRDRARARYSWDRIAADTLRIYDRSLAAGYQRKAATISSG
ncbi:glycosyltransferase [Mycobacterium hubeiense]|uniref:glycosyltransferase n=1 Tax=Mycobacterium hubeiense TaxID=1867256 RepID=UPI000C7F084F|nr:glycosyltransferase [Mycobacterium sp. QGD 101]